MKRRLLVMETTRSVARALCLLLLLAGGASAQEVQTDHDQDADFSKYKTFAWVASKGQTEGFADKRVKQAVEQQLRAKGLQSSAGATPDLYVAYKVGVRQLTSAPAPDFHYDPDRLDDRSASSAQVVSLEGKLVVDLVDGVRKELVWRGTAVAEVSEESAKNKEKIEKAVSKMFKKFPPPPKGR
jgi:Domain of unknown function (DUF4136)